MSSRFICSPYQVTTWVQRRRMVNLPAVELSSAHAQPCRVCARTGGLQQQPHDMVVLPVVFTKLGSNVTF
ncbi:unnamed protein product [Boreogadus saida]